jgi:hypothetical protein
MYIEIPYTCQHWFFVDISVNYRIYSLTVHALSPCYARGHKTQHIGQGLDFSMSWASLSSSPHDSGLLFPLSFGQPRFLFPSGVHRSATLVMLAGFLDTCSIHRHLILVNSVLISLHELPHRLLYLARKWLWSFWGIHYGNQIHVSAFWDH